MLILQVVATGASYGYAITQEVLQRSNAYFQIKEGSLYPALHRLEKDGLLESYWEEVGPKRRRKYYRLTAKGSAALEEKQREWQDFTKAVDGVMGRMPDAMA